jgi:hypothetical protein
MSSYTSKSALAKGMLEAESCLFTPERLTRILASDFQVPYEDVREEWNDSFAPIVHESILDIFLEHIGDYHVQRRTRPRLEQARYACLPVYPFMDYKLYRTVRRLPLEHLDAEKTHLGVLRGYMMGLEHYPHADHWTFRLPILKEYKYRRLIDLGRMVNQTTLKPVRHWAKEKLYAWGVRTVDQQPYWLRELPLLKHYPQFDSAGLTELIEETKQGTFLNFNAIRQLFNVQVIHDLLFGKGLAHPEDVAFIQPQREVRFENYEPSPPGLNARRDNIQSCCE